MAGMTSCFKLLIFLWVISCISLKAGFTKLIYFVEEEMSWKDAKQYCQTKYTDLITLWSKDEPDIVSIVEEHLSVSEVWIGLNRDPQNGEEWRWTEPRKRYHGMDLISHDCAFTSNSAKLQSSPCSREAPFYCSPNNILHKKRSSWYDAQAICRQHAGELSTINTSNMLDFTRFGWVGMHRDKYGIWWWTGGQSDFWDWKDGHPRNYDCAAYNIDSGAWRGYPCYTRFPFLCYESHLIVVTENKTWEEALQHCWSLGDNSSNCDLVSSQYDNGHFGDRVLTAVTNEVWIGLRFLAGQWKWMDGEKMKHQGLPLCAPQWKHCGTRHKYNPNLEIRDCMEKRNFICYKYPIYHKP